MHSHASCDQPWCRLGPQVHAFWDTEIRDGWLRREPETLETLHTLLGHIMMRHSKTQTIHGKPILELPPCTSTIVAVEFVCESEQYLYQMLFQQLQAELSSEGDEQADFQSQVQGAFHRLVCAWLFAWRNDLQLCVDSALAACSHASNISLTQLNAYLTGSRQRSRRHQLVLGMTKVAKLEYVQAQQL